MKKRVFVLLTAVALMISACGGNGKREEKETQSSKEFVLGQYEGLHAEKTVYIVTDKDIDNEVQSMLEEYVEYRKLDRKSREGDYVNFDLKATAGEEEIEDYTGDGFGSFVGSEDFDDEFEQHLIGVKAGDHLTFSVSYDDDYVESVLAGKEVDYDVKVNSVEEEVYPEMTDSFVKDKLGYDSEEALRNDVRSQLETDNDSDAYERLKNDLMQQIVDGSTFGGYPKDMYEQCKASVEEQYLQYAQWFGGESVEDVYEAFGLTDEDIEEEILELVHIYMVSDAIAKEQKLDLSDEEFSTYLEKTAQDLEYEDTDTLVADYGEEELKTWAIQEKVISYVVEKAEITELRVEQNSETDTEAEVEEEVK